MAAPRWRAGAVRRRSGCRRSRFRPLPRGRRRRVARGRLRPSARGRLGRGSPPAGCRAGTRHRSRQRLLPARPRARRRQWHLRYGRTGRGRNVSSPAARWGAAGGTRHRRAVGFYRAPDGVGIDPGTAPYADGPSPFPRGTRNGRASNRARRWRGVRPEDAPLSGGSGSLRRGPQAGAPRKVDRGPAGEPPGPDAGQGAGDRGPGCGGSRRTPAGLTGPHCLRPRCLFGLPLDRGARAALHGREQARLRAAGRIGGVGLSGFVDYTGVGSVAVLGRGMREVRGDDSAAVKVDGSGGVRAYVAAPSQVQGHETVFAQLVGETLGLSPEDVEVVPVDTASVPVGTGTFASRAMIAGGGALLQAAAGVRSKALQIAAHLLEAPAPDIEIAAGRFCVSGSPGRGVTWAEVARVAYLPGSGLPAGAEPGLEASVTYDPPPAVFSNGVHAAMVEVDRETGQVTVRRYAIAEDCGPLINPRIVDGQIHGGLAQGFGEALLEQVVYDAEGQPLTTTFIDYLISPVKAMPPVAIGYLETHT